MAKRHNETRPLRQLADDELNALTKLAVGVDLLTPAVAGPMRELGLLASHEVAERAMWVDLTRRAA